MLIMPIIDILWGAEMIQIKTPASHCVFTELNGRAFATYRALEEAVLKEFNNNLADFPPGYTYRNLIEWGEQKRWIQKVGQRGYAIFFDSEK